MSAISQLNSLLLPLGYLTLFAGLSGKVATSGKISSWSFINSTFTAGGRFSRLTSIPSISMTDHVAWHSGLI
ncbi:hypothetical protein CPB84DRAFT_1783515 [Gymnopilus junonius]|uniref:Uncharacterized protein n=1 Tax=Gymnopilus junonius TaxID=109634 RepID=A0A9P5NJL0_GYMJU|nr:hypothetical protein CPB84DRAFT_1783515 [Gymnopilus junonius]